MAQWFDKLQSWMDGNRSAERAGSAPSAVHVTAFGKHPGWDDHIDDIPLPTQTLVDFQRLLYLHGVGQNIETGRWQNAPAGNALSSFDHWIFWSSSPNEFVLARMWSSIDGKGRTSYPLIVATQINDLPSMVRLDAAIEVLSSLETRARAASRADDVRLFVSGAQVELQAALAPPATPAAPPPLVPSGDPLLRLEQCLTREGIYRLMYESARAGAATWAASDGAASRGVVTLRVKPCAESLRQEMAMWIAFASRLLRPRPILIAIGGCGPSAAGSQANLECWVDVICGESTAAELACLRFTEAMLPPTTSIPYSIDEAFAREADAALGRVTTQSADR